MLTLFKRWYHRHFSQPGTVEFALVLICSFLTVYYLMWLVGPLVVALCLAYCLDWPVEKLQKLLKVSRHIAVIAVMIVFCSAAVFTTVLLVPKMVKQGAEFYNTIVSFGLEATTANPPKAIDLSELTHDKIGSSPSIDLEDPQNYIASAGGAQAHLAGASRALSEPNYNFESLANFGDTKKLNTAATQDNNLNHSANENVASNASLSSALDTSDSASHDANIHTDASVVSESASSFSIPHTLGNNASIRLDKNTYLKQSPTAENQKVSLAPDKSMLLENGLVSDTNESPLANNSHNNNESAAHTPQETNPRLRASHSAITSGAQGASDNNVSSAHASLKTNSTSVSNEQSVGVPLETTSAPIGSILPNNHYNSIVHIPQNVTGHINGSLTHGFVARVEQNFASREPTFTLSVADFDRNIAHELYHLVISLPEPLPSMLSLDTLESSVRQTRIAGTNKIADLMRTQLAPSVVNAFTWLVYLIIVPIFTFLMLYNKRILQLRVARFILPSNQKVMKDFWPSLHHQISGYIRGKLIHVFIIAIANSLAFVVMGVNYALLLGVGVGLSVIIPYVGAVIIAVPVLIVSIFQFGFGTELWWVLIIYTFIQLLDSNVLTPMLFSKAMNLDAFSILAAILIFGGLWGFWGVFFAIPLATFIKTLITRWPSLDRNNPQHDYEFNFQRIAFQQIEFRRDLKDAQIIEATDEATLQQEHDAKQTIDKDSPSSKDHSTKDASSSHHDASAKTEASDQDKKKASVHEDINDSAML